MANQVVELYEALLQSIAALDDTPCGLEGLAAAARQQQEQCHAFKQLLKEFKQAGISQQSNWKKLISDHEVGIRYMTNVLLAIHSCTPGLQASSCRPVVICLLQAGHNPTKNCTSTVASQPQHPLLVFGGTSGCTTCDRLGD